MTEEEFQKAIETCRLPLTEYAIKTLSRMKLSRMKLGRDFDDADEIVQKAVIRFYEKLQSFQGHDLPAIFVWLKKAVDYLIQDFKRHLAKEQKRLVSLSQCLEVEKEIFTDDADSQMVIVRDGVKDPYWFKGFQQFQVEYDLGKAIRDFPKDIREAFWERYEGATFREIGDEMGLNRTRLESMLSPYRLTAQDRLKDYAPVQREKGYSAVSSDVPQTRVSNLPPSRSFAVVTMGGANGPLLKDKYNNLRQRSTS